LKNSKNGGFLSIILCVLLIASTIGSSFGIKNSYAHAQLQTQQPSTLSQQPSTLSQQPLTLLQQPLCRGGICDNNATQPNNLDPRHAVISSSKTFVNSKNLDLNHAFVSNKVIGPDRFRFVTSYWTTSTTSQVIDAGTSTNESRFITSIGSGVGAGPGTYGWKSLEANPYLEVDTGEGYSTLAVVLQYQGVVRLAGITAALKLPAGFEAQIPVADERNNYGIALSSYHGNIFPSQGVVLYFSLNVLPSAKVQLPVLGPLALHFLRADQRSILDSLDASQQDLFAKALSVTNTTFPNSTSFKDNFDFARNYFGQFGRFIPFDFINQVIPVVFKVTGREVLDVHLAYPTVATRNCITYQCNITKGIVPGNGDIVPVRVTFSNFGDAVITDLVGTISTATQTLVGSAVSAQTYPLGIVSPTTFNIGVLPPYSSQSVTLLVRSVLNCDTLQPLNVASTYNDVIGLRQTQQNDVVLQITGDCRQQVLGVEPGSGIPEVIPQAQGALALPAGTKVPTAASTLLARPAPHYTPIPQPYYQVPNPNPLAPPRPSK
jgi:hypothetical protein